MIKRVVITGLGTISPVGNDVPTACQSLIEGKCGIDTISHFDPKADPNCKVSVAGEVKNFDPTLYMEKSDARKSDLYAQYAMGTFMTEDKKWLDNGMRKVSPYFIPMLISNIASGNIAIRFKANGPSMCIATACATSCNCIGEAFHTIRYGYADAMITGGAEATINPLAVAGFMNCKALTLESDPKKASVPFDKNRSGFVMGEGGAMMVLEEYEHAVQRGAHIYAEIVGYGNTNDAHHMTAPDPEAKGSAHAIELAIEEAGMPKDATLYINAHGTSTHLNDLTETKAFKLALGEENARKAMISSTKSMTGHMLGATGAFEAIACAKALEEGIVPPTIGYTEPDPECDLDYTPNTAKKADLQYAISTNLGFGGHNACLVLKKI